MDAIEVLLKRLISLIAEKVKRLNDGAVAFIKVVIKSQRFKRALSVSVSIVELIAVIVTVFLLVFMAPPALQDFTLALKSGAGRKKTELPDEKITEKRLKQLQLSVKTQEKKLDRKTPPGSYLVVNSTENKIFLYTGKNLKLEGVCSTGSYIMLQAADERKWIFKTPKGVFRIRGKITSPVWIKPDWAFIEEGLPVPASNAYERYEYGVLGDYALSLGQGYLIHGTLYQRFLGMPVTHGCVRLGDEDLKVVYHALDIGSKVFIF